MKSRIAKLTVVAVVLLSGASQIRAADAAASPGNSPFSQLPGFGSQASYSGYIGDESDLRVPPGITGATPETIQDTPSKGKSGIRQKSAAKGGHNHVGKGDAAEPGYIYSPWFSFEYMNTWLEGRYLPPLVSTSPPGSEGVVPGATVLFGGDEVSGNRQAAGKISFGGWFDDSERLGAGGKYFQIQTETVPFQAASNSNGNPLLARPFYETWPLADGGVGPASFLVTGPTSIGTLPFTLAGDIQAVTHTDVLGAEGYLRYLLYCAPGRRVDLIGGYQFSRVDDTLQIDHRTNYSPQTFGARFVAEDLFDTQNRFHGGELGLLGEFGKGAIILSILGKVGLGNMNEVVNISGRSALTDAGGHTAYYNGGILALPSNMGRYEQNKFAVIPEAEIKLIFKLTRRLEMSVGYDFIYWSTLALAGDQIETNASGLPVVNSSQWFGDTLDPSGGVHPSFEGIKDSSLWLQGLSVGLTLRM